MTGAAQPYRRPIIERVWACEPPYRAMWIAATPLSVAYAGILAARSIWWRRVARHAPLPTVSVGNLTIGGNGKTPFALSLAARLRQRGLRIGIVSRGYGGQWPGRASLVSDGQRILMTPRQAGDEPMMLAKSFDGPIAVARRRIAAIELLATSALADAVVLDDGFQHLRLRRDVDLLLVNEALAFGNGWVLPAGPMREPLSAIRRADAIVLVGSSDAKADTIDFRARDLMRGKLVLRAWLQPSEMIHSDGGLWHEARLALAGRRVAAVSGIANPAAFHAMMRALGANLIRTLDYPDHHDYGPGDWENILAAAQQAEMLITTEKDLVKLERFAAVDLPLYALRLKVTMDERDEKRLLALILERIRRPTPAN